MSERRRLERARRKAPKEPRAVALDYAQALTAWVDGIEHRATSLLMPAIEREFGRVSDRHVAPPEDPNALVGMRRDVSDDSLFSAPLGDLAVDITRRVQSTRGLVDAQGRRIGTFNHRDMQRVLGIDLAGPDTGLGPFADTFRERNVRLIRSLGDGAFDRVSAILQTAQREGYPVRRIAELLQETFSVARSRAMLIARDQTLKANADLTQLRSQRAGATGYFWISSKDERVRGRPGGKWEASESNHWILDGRRFEWTHPPVTNLRRGERNHPGRDYQCRCTASPDLGAIFDD